MNRHEFLRALRANRPVLTAVSIDGLGTIYLRPVTMAEVRAQIAAAAKKPAAAPPAGAAQAAAAAAPADDYGIERGIARVVRDESGALLFDASDDAAMVELRDALDGASPRIAREIQEAYARLERPTAAEVDPSGNSPSASS